MDLLVTNSLTFCIVKRLHFMFRESWQSVLCWLDFSPPVLWRYNWHITLVLCVVYLNGHNIKVEVMFYLVGILRTQAQEIVSQVTLRELFQGGRGRNQVI